MRPKRTKSSTTLPVVCRRADREPERGLLAEHGSRVQREIRLEMGPDHADRAPNPDHLHGRTERGRPARAFDHGFGSPAAGEIHHRSDGILSGRVDGHGTHGLRLLQPSGDRVHGDDPAGGESGAQDGHQADRPAAHDHHGIAQPDARPFDSPVGGGQDVGHEHACIIGYFRREQPEITVRVGDEHLLGLATIQPGIGPGKTEEGSALTLGLHPAPTGPAHAAGGHRGADHSVSRFHLRDRGADVFHDADELMAHGRAPLKAGHISPVRQEVGPTDGSLGDLEDRVLRGVDLGVGDLVDPETPSPHQT